MSAPSTQRWIALLRAINVGGRRLPMARLRALAEGLGWTQVRSYLQSGNLMFQAEGAAAALEVSLESALAQECGFEVPVLVRSQSHWQELASSNPFPGAATARPKLLHLGLSKATLATDAAERLQAVADPGERIWQDASALWIDFGESVAASKLTAARIDRCAGSVVTLRNWRTICALAASAT